MLRIHFTPRDLARTTISTLHPRVRWVAPVLQVLLSGHGSGGRRRSELPSA